MKNKDGTLYLLVKPNKLGKTQIRWDRSKIALHNCLWNDESQQTATLPDSQIVDRYQKSRSVPLSEPKIEEPKIEEPKIEEPKIEPKIEIETQETEETLAFTIPKLKYVVLFHCLPVRVRYTRDELYDEDIPTLEYGEKFIFPGVILDSNDFAIQFWTTDPNNQIKERAIVYPFRYRKGPALKEFRWWKIDSKTKKDPGYTFEGIVSDFQPDFSD
jgi:hypothetical protein